MSACIKLSVNCNWKKTHHLELTETLMVRSRTRSKPQATYLRLRSLRRFHCRVSPPVFSHAAGWWFGPSLSWWKVLLIPLLGGLNSRTPAHRPEASFDNCCFISELPNNQAWCSQPAVKLSFRVSGSTVTPSISRRKLPHDASHLLPPPFLFTPQFPLRVMSV